MGLFVDGPNNQFVGVVDLLVLAKILGRVAILPKFHAEDRHKFQGLTEFTDVFDIESLKKQDPLVMSPKIFLSHSTCGAG